VTQTVPIPTPIYRLVHVENLPIFLRRQALHAPNDEPKDGEVYRTIHRVDVQVKRQIVSIPRGPRGTIHDYVPFYFGYHSPMLLQLKTGQVPGYAEGQDPLIYLVTSCQAVRTRGGKFVFSDGHGVAMFTAWFDDLAQLPRVDWGMVSQRYWADSLEDRDRQRRKQAEFLVHRSCPWDWIDEIGVVNDAAKVRVEAILASFPTNLARPVLVRPGWYYP
jgi:hypothetical protein